MFGGSGNSSRISSSHWSQAVREIAGSKVTCFARLRGGASSGVAAGVNAGAKMFQRWAGGAKAAASSVSPVSNVAAEMSRPLVQVASVSH
eukprot:9782050-Prorocentrum_lima.AAC.1